MGDPTAVYTVSPPDAFAVSSTIMDVATVTTTFPPFLFPRRYLARSARATSPGTYPPSDVTKTHLSASPSWAIPRSAPVSFTVSISSPRFSAVGSLRCPGWRISGSPFRTTVVTPKRSRRSGDVAQEQPLAQSRTTLRPAPRIESASIFEITESIYSSAAPPMRSTVPMESHGTALVPAWYDASMASSCSLVHSVPSPAMHFIPLNSGGLWDAVIITPPSMSSRILM